MADQPTIGELLKDLRGESTLLLREEIALAKKEISEKISSTALNLIYVVGGALVAYVAITFLFLLSAPQSLKR
jgi:Putative Actinobacterial Holin-X, holin superfamily III